VPKRGLDVFTAGTRAGRLSRSDREPDTILFSYGEGCLPAEAVSLTMPVRADQYDAAGGLLPIAGRFAQRLAEVMTRGLDRLGYKPIPISPPQPDTTGA
jgi:hypothetical protein